VLRDAVTLIGDPLTLNSCHWVWSVQTLYEI